jgi:hypothetical protein
MREANTALAEELRACAKARTAIHCGFRERVLNDPEVQALRLPPVARDIL